MRVVPSPEAALRLVAVDTTWSRRITVAAHDGGSHEWHLLDRPGTDPTAPIVVCLHGNPTWSVIWSRLIRELDPAHRVIAPDHLSMGWSERLPHPRRYRDRVLDVVDLLEALGLGDGPPVWLVGHDWGGAIAMGVAAERPDRVAGLLLANTGIAVPAGRRAPRLIRLAAQRGLHELGTLRTPAFVVGTPLLPGRHIARPLRQALAAPYHGAARRTGVAAFVADVPFDEQHPSSADIAAVATALPGLAMPVHLVWGARDPVFDDSFADDLLARFRGATLHRWAGAGHLVALEESIAPVLEAAITASHDTGDHDTGDLARAGSATDEHPPAPLWAAVAERAGDDTVAIADASDDTTVSRSEFDRRVASAATALTRLGVAPGDRVAVLVPPGADLLTVVYACWRIGAVTVVADRGLGLRGLGRAVRSARVQHVVGVAPALVAARLGRWAPGARRLTVDAVRGTSTAGEAVGLRDLRLPEPMPGDPAAVVFTSGATGPAKGVRYTHAQLGAQRDALRRLYGITGDDRFVAAFAPFAVFGPALGITTCFADMDVTSPRTLTADALEAACAAVDATMVFGAPAALANVVRTRSGATPALGRVRLVLSAGAPVPERVAAEMRRICPEAEVHTPYGMTEVLPVADISTDERDSIGPGRGVCVGRPVDDCEVTVLPLTAVPLTGQRELPVPLRAGETGEITVRSSWMSSGYDRLWLTEAAARVDVSGASDGRHWHRTGDVGHLDEHGRLWVEGRVAHVIHTSGGTITPVPLEVAAERLAAVSRAAAVGVGPVGCQQVVLVVDPTDGSPDGPATVTLTDAVRAAVAPVPVAAVWVDRDLPVDIRHNSKIDRAALAATMARRLSGARR